MKDDKKLIYISGPISGNLYWKSNFIYAGRLVKSRLKDYKAVNPLRFNLAHNPRTTWADQMIVCLRNLEHCDAILMLDGWEKSKGACIEKLFAEKLGLGVMYEKDLINDENGTGKD